MPMKSSSSFRKITPNGTFGTLSKASGHFAEFAGDAADTTIAVAHFDAGTTFHGVKTIHEAMGAGTGIQVGIAFYDAEDGTDDPDFFSTVADSAAAGNASWGDTVVPVTFNVPVKLTVTNTDAVATGRVDVIPEYVYTGGA